MTRFFLGILLVSTLTISGQERILSFDSHITINTDSSVDVQETITVFAQGQKIVHGIMREFPTRYKDRYGHEYQVGFALQEARVKNEQSKLQKVPVKTVKRANGIVLYLGNPDRRLRPGIYTYVIRYSVTRVLGFFKEYDELYWNVTGNGWRFSIDEARAVIKLPQGVNAESLVFDAYTGPFGTQGKNFTTTKDAVGNLVFQTQRALTPYRGIDGSSFLA